MQQSALRCERQAASECAIMVVETTVAPTWIDTHAHLDDERFHDDLPAVLERAAGAGLERIVVVATTSLDSPRCIDLASRHPILRATVGIQPNHVAEASATAW